MLSGLLLFCGCICILSHVVRDTAGILCMSCFFLFVANVRFAHAPVPTRLSGSNRHPHSLIACFSQQNSRIYHIRNVWEILYQVYIIFSCLFYIQKFNLEVQFLACHLMVCIKGDRSVILGGYLNRERLSGRI